MIEIKQGSGMSVGTPLPDGWRWVRLGDVCDAQSGGTPSRGRPNYFCGNIPWAKIEDLTRAGMYINNTNEGITELGLQESSARLFPPGTLLFAMYGSIGTASITQIDISTNQAILGCQCSSLLIPEFLWFWLSHIKPRLVARGAGGTQPNLNATIVKDIEIPLPSLTEQRRIVAKLSGQMAAVEQARAAAQMQLEAAKALATAYLRGVFESPEAKQWSRKRLGEILHLRKEIVHPRDNPHGQARFVGLEHIESGTGLRTGVVEIEMSELTGRKPRFYKGDIVYGYLRPYLNKVWIAEFEGLCSVDQYVYSVVREEADTDFVAWFMRSPTYLNRAPIDTTPGQLPRIRTEEVASVEISLPPLLEQRRIVEKLREQMTQVEQIRRFLTEQLTAINKLPNVLLRRAFSGEL